MQLFFRIEALFIDVSDVVKSVNILTTAYHEITLQMLTAFKAGVKHEVSFPGLSTVSRRHNSALAHVPRYDIVTPQGTARCSKRNKQEQHQQKGVSITDRATEHTIPHAVLQNMTFAPFHTHTRK